MSTKDAIAREISQTIPTFLRHMYPYIMQPNKLPPSQLLAVVTLHEVGGCRLGELSRHMHIAPPTASGIVDRLEKAGFVRRVSDAEDRRAKTIVLTARGEQVVINFRAIIRKRWEYILTKINQKDAEQLIRLLKMLTKGFTDGTI